MGQKGKCGLTRGGPCTPLANALSPGSEMHMSLGQPSFYTDSRIPDHPYRAPFSGVLTLAHRMGEVSEFVEAAECSVLYATSDMTLAAC